MQAFKRHASLGFLAVSAFPLPKDYISGVTLPAGLSMDGKRALGQLTASMDEANEVT